VIWHLPAVLIYLSVFKDAFTESFFLLKLASISLQNYNTKE